MTEDIITCFTRGGMILMSIGRSRWFWYIYVVTLSRNMISEEWSLCFWRRFAGAKALQHHYAVALSRCRWDSVDGGLSLTFTIYSVGKVLQEPRIAPWRSQKNLQTLKKLQLRAQMLPVTNILGVNQFAT